MCIIYQWDENKADSNLKTHRISFEESVLVFEDNFALEYFDDEHSNIDEQRFIRIGLAKAKVVFVVYTIRGENPEIRRIISARYCEKDEENQYWSEKYGQ
jgi:uncharacterized protein